MRYNIFKTAIIHNTKNTRYYFMSKCKEYIFATVIGKSKCDTVWILSTKHYDFQKHSTKDTMRITDWQNKVNIYEEELKEFINKNENLFQKNQLRNFICFFKYKI